MPPHARWLLLILSAALAVRIVLAVGLQAWLDRQPDRTFLIPGDADGYWELGQRMAAGRPYELYAPPRRVLRMPGFPAVLAAAIKLAPNAHELLAARLMLGVVGTAACGLVYLLGRQLADERAALLAAAYTAVSPTLAFFSVLILSETLFAACLVLNLVCLAGLYAGLQRRQGFCWAVAAGVSAAAASYVRPSWLPFAPAAALLFALFSPRQARTWLQAGVVTASLLLALLPWTVRNHHVTGHWVLTTLWLGPSLYDGLNPHATGESDMSFFERDAPRLAGLTEYEIDRHYRREAWEFVRQNPGRTLELAAAKFLRFWKPWPNAPQFRSAGACAGVALFFLPLVLFAGVGLFSRRGHWLFRLLTAGPVLFFTLVHLLFVSSLRYRLPAEYPLAVAAAAGCWAWMDRFRSSRLFPGRG